MKFIQLLTTTPLILVLSPTNASASFLAGKYCTYTGGQCGRDKYCQVSRRVVQASSLCDLYIGEF
eukprot:scaffold7742_cov103-Alexandrium_tamarense.AAC.1